MQDENKDGVFTVQELIQWIETNKLVKFESEGRDADMDKIMESHTAEKDTEESEEEAGATAPKEGSSSSKAAPSKTEAAKQ